MFHIIPANMKNGILVFLFIILVSIIAISLKRSKFYANAFTAIIILMAIIAFIC